MDPKTTRNLWPNTNAVVISDETNLALVMKGLLNSLEWQLDHNICNPKTAIERIHDGFASMIIVVDSLNRPAFETLRTIFKHPRVRLTPVLVLASEHNSHDKVIFQKIFCAGTVLRPISPGNFFPPFKSFVKTWESPVYKAIRAISYSEVSHLTDKKIEILEKILSDHNYMGIVLPALIRIFIGQGNYARAEKLLLNLLHSNPKNAVVIAQCAWFYLESATPQQALIFLKKLKSLVPMSLVFNFDTASAHIACGNLQEASVELTDWCKRFPNDQRISSFLSRILIAEGQTDIAEKIGINKQLLTKATDLWDEAEIRLSGGKQKGKSGDMVS